MTESFEYIAHPGEFLREVLEVRGMSQAELSRRTGISEKHLSQIANGEANINVEAALALERAFPDRGISYWMSLQEYYDRH